MKYILLTMIFLLSINIYGQDPIIYTVHFDFNGSPPGWWGSWGHYEIDTTDTNNIWQVGPPQKTIFNYAESSPNVIVTDTINPYTTNDTSSFIIKYENTFPDVINEFEGSYYCDTDSLNDYGMMEVSFDSSQTWHNISFDTLNVFQFYGTPPIFTGSSGGWKRFSLFYDATSLDSYFTSVWYKFTFISDSIDTQQEGLMFDNFGFFATNTENLYQLDNLKVFPNPTSDILHFEFEERIEDAEIRIYSTIGQLMTHQNITNTDVQFNVSDWQKGIYFYGIYVEGRLVRQGQILVVR